MLNGVSRCQKNARLSDVPCPMECRYGQVEKGLALKGPCEEPGLVRSQQEPELTQTDCRVRVIPGLSRWCFG